MANFSKLIVTNKGKELIAKALANTAVITFTKVSSSGTVYDEDELEALVGLEDIHQTSLISGISLTNNTSVEIQASFTNTELTEGYYLRALGLYAEDPDVGEILYGVTAETSGNCYIPAYNGVTSSGIYLQFVTTVGNAENVSLEINPAAIATIKDVQKVEEKLKILDFDDSGEVEGIESFTDFMSSFVKGTNIYQFFSNLKAGLNYVLHAGQLVNSGMCETPGMFALDAAYGKTLTDQITGLYSDMQNLFIVKNKNISVNITSVGQAGVIYVPFLDIPEGYTSFLQIPTSGSPNLLVANSQVPIKGQWGSGWPVRYIGYQTGSFPIGVWFFYVRDGIVQY